MVWEAEAEAGLTEDMTSPTWKFFVYAVEAFSSGVPIFFAFLVCSQLARWIRNRRLMSEPAAEKEDEGKQD